MEPNKEPTVVINETKWPDSCEFGTASKGGGVKIYFNASNREEANKRIQDAIEIFESAKTRFEKIIKP